MPDTTIWDFWAERYERLWVQKYSLAPTRRAVLDELGGVLRQGQSYRILDIGCGTGQLLREIQAGFPDYGLELNGLDISHRMIEVARGKSSGIQYACGSVDEFAAEPGSFDIITCTHSFPYYPDKPGAIARFAALLKTDGRLYLAQASQNSFYDAFVMAFVKFTTSKAQYPSVKEMDTLLSERFSDVCSRRIRERFYMPSIYVFACKR